MSDYAKQCMEEVRDKLINTKPAGNWWAKEVMDQRDEGKAVTPAALSLAKHALDMPE
jgi:hypothetical protein